MTEKELFMKTAGILQGTFTLIAMNMIVRLLSFSYDILLSKRIGAEAAGLFQMSSTVLTVLLVITSSGIPSAVSRLIAEQSFRNNRSAVERTFRTAVIFTLLLSTGIAFVLLLCGKTISMKILANEDTLPSIYLLAPAVVIISMTSVIRGYYYGLKKMGTAGVSEIIEHVSRFALVLGFLAAFSPVKPADGAFIAVAGISIGEAFDLIWLAASREKPGRQALGPSFGQKAKKNILPQLLRISAPLTFSGLLGILLQFLNAVLIPQKLMEAGYTSSEAVASFGRIAGMAMPLVYLPFIVTSALVVNIIPGLSGQVSGKNFIKAGRDIALSVKLTLLVSVPLTALYLLYSDQLGIFLYSDSQVGAYIKIMGCSTIFLTLQHTLSGILYGMGKQIQAAVHRFIGMVLQLSAVYFLAGNPEFGINGYFIGFTLSTALICLLDWIAIGKPMKLGIRYTDTFLKPMAAAAFMMIIHYLLQAAGFRPETPDPAAFLLQFLICGISYLLMLDILKAVPPNMAGRILRLYRG